MHVKTSPARKGSLSPFYLLSLCLAVLQNSLFLTHKNTPSLSLSYSFSFSLSLFLSEDRRKKKTWELVLNPSFLLFQNHRAIWKTFFAIIFNHMRPSQSRPALLITFAWVSGSALQVGVVPMQALEGKDHLDDPEIRSIFLFFLLSQPFFSLLSCLLLSSFPALTSHLKNIPL